MTDYATQQWLIILVTRLNELIRDLVLYCTELVFYIIITKDVGIYSVFEQLFPIQMY